MMHTQYGVQIQNVRCAPTEITYGDLCALNIHAARENHYHPLLSMRNRRQRLHARYQGSTGVSFLRLDGNLVKFLSGQ